MGLISILVALLWATCKFTFYKYYEYQKRRNELTFDKKLFIRSTLTGFAYTSLSVYGFLVVTTALANEANPIPFENTVRVVLSLLLDLSVDITFPHLSLSADDKKMLARRKNQNNILTAEVLKGFLYFIYAGIALVLYFLILGIIKYRTL